MNVAEGGESKGVEVSYNKDYKGTLILAQLIQKQN